MVSLLPEMKSSFDEFIKGIKKFGIMPHFRFRRSQSGDVTEHDWVFLVNTRPPHNGAHIGRCCTCCIGNGSINDYDHFKESFSYEEYETIVNLLFDYIYTDAQYKSIQP